MREKHFYGILAGAPLRCATVLPEGYDIRIWRPSRDGLPTPPLSGKSFVVWWLFDRLRVFANRNAGVVMICDGERLVHRSLVTPRWYRFPFMRTADLQIGDTWTDEAERGRGLARAAIAAIHDAWSGQFDRMWYVVGNDNPASVAVIEACGYELVGTGKRTRPLGLSLLGRFVIT